MSERVDIIVDFSNAAVGDKIFLENIMAQDDGRGPDGVDTSEKVRLLKFKVVDGSTPDLDIDTSTRLRPHKKIRARDIVRTRVFEFDRGNGAWQVNERFFNPRRADAVPKRDDANGRDAERWILRNDGGGWWHPIHIHLEHHEIQTINGRRPKKHRRFKSDVTSLAGDDEAEVFMRFRTFSGPFVFHCHNVEHEDMRMMGTFDPQPDGETDLNGVDPVASEISGVDEICDGHLLTVAVPGAPDEHEPFSDVVADLETIEDEGVGFPCTDFTPGEDD